MKPKHLKHIVAASALVLSAQSVMADVKSNLDFDVKSYQSGDNMATAETLGSGNENTVSAKAGSVNFNVDAKCCTDGLAKHDVKLKVVDYHKGKNVATAKKQGGGSMNHIEAAAGTVNMSLSNGVR